MSRLKRKEHIETGSSRLQTNNSSEGRSRTGGAYRHSSQLSDSDFDQSTYTAFRLQSIELTKKDLSGTKMAVQTHADGNFKCKCQVCEVEDVQKKEEKEPVRSIDFFNNFNFDQYSKNRDPEKDFVFILRKLIPPKPLPYTLRLFIPETISYVNGEPQLITLTEKDKKLRFIRSKEKLALGEIRRFFLECQKAKEKELALYDGKGDTPKDSAEDSIEVTVESGKTRSRSKTTKLFAKGSNKEVGLIKFKDDTTTVVTENEVNNILLKRKADAFWKKIQYLQMYVRTRRGINTLQRVYFVYERDKDDPLFERSLREIRYLNGEVPKASQDFIPLHLEEQFEEELRHSDENKYYLYLLMKVFHFIDVMWGLRIKNMGGDFIRDHLGITWLVNISRVQYEKSPPKPEEDDASVADENEKLQETIREDHNFNRMGRPPKPMTNQETIQALNNVIREHYENIRQNAGIDSTDVIYHESDEIANEENHNTSIKVSKLLNASLTESGMNEFTRQIHPKTFNRSSTKTIADSLNYTDTTKTIPPIQFEKSPAKVLDAEIRRPLRVKGSRKNSIQERERDNDASPTDFTSGYMIQPLMPKRPRFDSCYNDQSSPTSMTRASTPNRTNRRLMSIEISTKRTRYPQSSQSIEQSNASALQMSFKEDDRKVSSRTRNTTERMNYTRTFNFKTPNIKKPINVDLNELMNGKNKHIQWLKNLNNNIRARITTKLNTKVSSDTESDFNKTGLPYMMVPNV